MRASPIEGQVVEGRLAQLDATSVSLSTAAGSRTFDLEALRSLARVDATERTLAPRDHLRVTLTGGEVLLGTLAGAGSGGGGGEASDRLVLQMPDLGRVSLLLDVVATLVAVPADAGACFEPEHGYAAREDDVVYTRSGDAVTGIVLGLGDDGIEVETAVRGRTRRVAWDDLLVMHLQNDPPPAPDALRVELETTEGSRIEAGGDIATEGETLTFALRSAPGTRVELPWSAIRVIRPSGGSFVYASTLPFESKLVWYYRDDEREHGYLERWFQARANRRPSGCPLRLAGTTYRHGFAVQSRSTVTIETRKAWQRFESLFGVDDEAAQVAGGGSVDARVLGDGKVLWEARNVRVGEAPRRVGPLDVSQVQSLVLEVDFGTEGAVEFTGDRATWADPMLFR